MHTHKNVESAQMPLGKSVDYVSVSKASESKEKQLLTFIKLLSVHLYSCPSNHQDGAMKHQLSCFDAVPSNFVSPQHCMFLDALFCECK